MKALEGLDDAEVHEGVHGLWTRPLVITLNQV